MSLNSDRIVYRSLYSPTCIYTKYLYYSRNFIKIFVIGIFYYRF
ncbi:hypothetical protein Vi05172_g7500 [Venturia inaequalis]|nr:hypothetical protein Vi05172_g7500 [Venturia inaequalis]